MAHNHHPIDFESISLWVNRMWETSHGAGGGGECQGSSTDPGVRQPGVNNQRGR